MSIILTPVRFALSRRKGGKQDAKKTGFFRKSFLCVVLFFFASLRYVGFAARAWHKQNLNHEGDQ